MARFVVERMQVLEGGHTLAVCDLRVGEDFVVKGVAVRQKEGASRAFVAMPSYRDSKGAYHDVAFPTSKEARQELDSAVLGAYREAQKARVAQMAEATR